VQWTNYMKKQIKGEKYIYLLMGYNLAKETPMQHANVGNDTGVRGGQNFWRGFTIQEYKGRTLLIEKKNNSSFAEFSRVFQVLGNNIYEYINEYGENCSKRWEH